MLTAEAVRALLADLESDRIERTVSTDKTEKFSEAAADGAIGGHIEAVKACFDDFERLSGRIATQVGLALP